ncbi:MAG: nucleotidyltransferase family protein, partial [Lachnospiraceae bacterium]|nr:nucleotidyltransferase family protein [Lachnospiraceae bacterium]
MNIALLYTDCFPISSVLYRRFTPGFGSAIPEILPNRLLRYRKKRVILPVERFIHTREVFMKIAGLITEYNPFHNG